MNVSTAFCGLRGHRAPLAHVTVAIPVKNESRRIARLLHSLTLAAERAPLPVTALILANDCTDGTAGLARAQSSARLGVEVHEVALPPHLASAGHARRLAMDLGARPGALVMSTDGDAVLDADWIAAALDAVAGGADLVCGAVRSSCGHVLATRSGARIAAVEAPYADLVAEVRHALDRVAGRQPISGPRPHYTESGACLAIRADAYHAIGGLPFLRASEDRGLVHRAETHGLPIRYAPDMRAWVSGRLDGRAEGGMAACLRRRMREADPLADQAMLPPDVLAGLWRRAMAGLAPAYPDRSAPVGSPLRASDLEAYLPRLAAFVSETVRPQFTAWERAQGLGEAV